MRIFLSEKEVGEAIRYYMQSKGFDGPLEIRELHKNYERYEIETDPSLFIYSVDRENARTV